MEQLEGGQFRTRAVFAVARDGGVAILWPTRRPSRKAA